MNKSKYLGKFVVGQMFGKWKIINTNVIVQNEAKVLCICECGTEKLVSAFFLLNGKTTQCRKCADKLKNVQVIPQSMINEIKKFAEKNKISFELTEQDIMDISFKYVLEKKKLEQPEIIRSYNMSTQISGCYSGGLNSSSYSMGALSISEPTLNLVNTTTYTGAGLYGAGNSGINTTIQSNFAGTGSYMPNVASATANYEPYLYRVDESKGYTKDNTVIVNKSDVLSQRNSTSIQTAITSLGNIKQDVQKFKTNSTLNFLLNRRD